MISNGMKTSFNLSRPKFGIKSYNVRDSHLEEPIYKIPKIALGKLDKQDHFTDKAAFLTKKFPAAKYDIIADWSKPPMFSHS
jgi:hypothetical protein